MLSKFLALSTGNKTHLPLCFPSFPGSSRESKSTMAIAGRDGFLCHGSRYRYETIDRSRTWRAVVPRRPQRKVLVACIIFCAVVGIAAFAASRGSWLSSQPDEVVVELASPAILHVGSSAGAGGRESNMEQGQHKQHHHQQQWGQGRRGVLCFRCECSTTISTGRMRRQTCPCIPGSTLRSHTERRHWSSRACRRREFKAGRTSCESPCAGERSSLLLFVRIK